MTEEFKKLRRETLDTYNGLKTQLDDIKNYTGDNSNVFKSAKTAFLTFISTYPGYATLMILQNYIDEEGNVLSEKLLGDLNSTTKIANETLLKIQNYIKDNVKELKTE